jgi:ABC-type xylose transport system permease subunit
MKEQKPLRPTGLQPIDITERTDFFSSKHFNRVIFVTLLSCIVIGFCIGFITGFWLK